MALTPAPPEAVDLSALTVDERVEQFVDWAADLRLLIRDDGDGRPVRRPWVVEPFQRAFLRDVFRPDVDEVWLIVPEGNAKTTLTAGVGVHHLQHTPAANVPVAASSRDQATILFRQADALILRSPSLRGRFKSQEGYRRIVMGAHVNLDDDDEVEQSSRLQVYAADEKTGDGVIPTLSIIDELHRHRDLGLYRTWQGKGEKLGGKLIVISTAGEPGSEFEERRAELLVHADEREDHGEYVRTEGAGIVLHDYAVRDKASTRDVAAVKRANPLAQITTDRLARKLAKSSDVNHWQRLTCNIATRAGGMAIEPEVYDRLIGPAPEDRAAAVWSIGWVDLGWRIDTTAVGVLSWVSDERRIVHDVVILQPPVREDDVARAILERGARWRPFGFVYDPNAGGFQMAELIESGRHPLQTGAAGDVVVTSEPLRFIEHSQDNAPMSSAAGLYDEALRHGWLVLPADREVRRHHLNAVRKDVGGGGDRWRYDRPADAKGDRRRRFPIDALTGAVIGHAVAVAERSGMHAGVDTEEYEFDAAELAAEYADL